MIYFGSFARKMAWQDVFVGINMTLKKQYSCKNWQKYDALKIIACYNRAYGDRQETH